MVHNIVDIVYNLHSLMIFLKGRLLEGEIDKHKCSNEVKWGQTYKLIKGIGQKWTLYDRQTDRQTDRQAETQT